ncbi:DUF4188 domain-containing protein [Microbacterium sp. A1-JK]|uniref:DUF4188 domain-containing protein n=1 Tax=Microbacterium sp. A1-JK TaxID=3177516 RepID=UPI0038860648
MTVEQGRRTHDHEGELVVFLIGMTLNRPWRVDAWWPAFMAMPRMLAELASGADSGLMGYRMTLGRGGPLLVQYWSSVEKLYGYASDREAAHRPAWADFNRRARKVPGAVGVWHETYVVERAESMYVDSPVRGLAAATSSVPIRPGRDRAHDRLGRG